MAQVQMPEDTRFHVEVFDESGAQIHFNNLTSEEFQDFEKVHMDDDLNYAMEVGPVR